MTNGTLSGGQGSSALAYIFTTNVLRRSILLALIVGCLLTVTNQLDVLLIQPFTTRLALKVFLNFLIPFVVSSTSAAINRPR